MKRLLPFLLLLLNFHLFAQVKASSSMTDTEIKKYAVLLAHRYIITDGHVDLPTILLEKKFKASTDSEELISTKKGNFDYKRAKEGGLDAPFMSIYVPSSYQVKPDNGKAFADSLIDIILSIPKQLPDKFALANTPAQVRANFKVGKISLPMGMENGAPVGKDLHNVRYFFDRGIRYITITHGKDNQFCDSSYDSMSTWNGLSPLGSEFVKEMNKVGMMVDISHVSDSAFYQVIRMTNVPVIASHSSCRYFTPPFKRNMSDDMLLKLKKNGGVINISFGSVFLDSVTRTTGEKNRKELQSLMKQKNIKAESPEGKIFIADFRKQHPYHFADVSDVVNHIDHVVKLIGIDHVGFGSDFDGVEDSLPVDLKDVSMYPNIIYGFLKKGYSDRDIEKICGGNFLRVWQQVIDAAVVVKK